AQAICSQCDVELSRLDNATINALLPGAGVGFDSDAEPQPNHNKNHVGNSLRKAMRYATPDQQAEVMSLAAYLTGNQKLALADLRPGYDGGFTIPSFVQDTIERDYAAFTPVVNVCRLFPTDP